MVVGGRFDDADEEIGQAVEDQRDHRHYPTHSFIIRVKSTKKTTFIFKIPIAHNIFPIYFRVIK